MNFGQALELLKKGHAVAREGWNGKGMYVYLNRGSISRENVSGVPGALINGIASYHFDEGADGTITRLPNINIHNPSGSISTWAPSITDTLAEDWIDLPATA